MLVAQDGSGEISSDEMEYFLSEDALRKYLEALSVTVEDTRMLFRWLLALRMCFFCDQILSSIILKIDHPHVKNPLRCASEGFMRTNMPFF